MQAGMFAQVYLPDGDICILSQLKVHDKTARTPTPTHTHAHTHSPTHPRPHPRTHSHAHWSIYYFLNGASETREAIRHG